MMIAGTSAAVATQSATQTLWEVHLGDVADAMERSLHYTNVLRLLENGCNSRGLTLPRLVFDLMIKAAEEASSGCADTLDRLVDCPPPDQQAMLQKILLVIEDGGEAYFEDRLARELTALAKEGAIGANPVLPFEAHIIPEQEIGSFEEACGFVAAIRAAIEYIVAAAGPLDDIPPRFNAGPAIHLMVGMLTDAALNLTRQFDLSDSAMSRDQRDIFSYVMFYEDGGVGEYPEAARAAGIPNIYQEYYPDVLKSAFGKGLDDGQ